MKKHSTIMVGCFFDGWKSPTKVVDQNKAIA